MPMELEKIRNEITLVQTCWACPAQWDAFYNKKMVGYIRFGGGYVSVECPDVGGELVYSMQTEDRMQGMFYTDAEENAFLSKALDSIAGWVGRNRMPPEIPKEDE